jgi:hypothetical protein
VDAAERFADGKATVQEMGKAFENADDSAFCNEDLEDVPTAAMRKACFGDDAGWPARMKLDQEEREEMETYPDPAAWLEADDNADFVLPAAVDPFRDVAMEDAVLVGETIGRKILLLVRHYGDEERAAEERKAQAALIRDIFGDPFPPPAFDPAWRTPDVTALATSIDDDRAFDRMPTLADALEKAGCHDPVILSHCRGLGAHVRGCWALDLILGKE